MAADANVKPSGYPACRLKAARYEIAIATVPTATPTDDAIARARVLGFIFTDGVFPRFNHANDYRLDRRWSSQLFAVDSFQRAY